MELPILDFEFDVIVLMHLPVSSEVAEFSTS
jgi:hypothetical protein